LFLFLAGELFHATQRVEAGQPVSEKDAVEVVQLVLERTSSEAVRLDANLFAMAVAAFDDHYLRSLHLAHPTRVAQAALVTDLDSFLLHNLRIHQAPDLFVVALDDADAQRDADLVGREPGPGGIEHGLGQIVEEALDGRVDTRDFFRLFAQDWLFEAEDRPDHEPDSTRGV